MKNTAFQNHPLLPDHFISTTMKVKSNAANNPTLSAASVLLVILLLAAAANPQKQKIEDELKVKKHTSSGRS